MEQNTTSDAAADARQTTPGALAERLKPKGGVSEVAGETDRPLIALTIPQLLHDTVAAHRDRDALIDLASGKRFSWADFDESVDILARGLASLDLGKGDRVGIWSPNRYEWVLAQFATARIGIVLVNINPAYRSSELEFALNAVASKALILAANFKTSDYIGMLGGLAPELETARPGALSAARLPDLRTVIRLGSETTPGMLNFVDVMDAGRASDLDLDTITATLHADDPVNIQFTSGTTGTPKGATLTHRNLVNNADQVTRRILFTENDRLCIPVPLYHCFGMSMGTLGCVSKGAAMILPGEGFDPMATLDAIEQERCTALYAVPTMFVAMLGSDGFEARDLSSLRTGIMAGAPCPIEIMRRVVDRMHMDQVTIAYGMTETAPVSFQSHVDDPLDKRVSTVGRVHPHIQVKIVDAEDRPVPVGTPGELWTRGYSVMRGYWADEAQTEASITVDGWMKTGDLATIDADGYCAIVGRVKDMVIRGGENIYPREVEEYLYRHPAIQDVQVFGVPDDKYGEELCAWVVVRPGEALDAEGVRDFCREEIAHYKIPKHIRFKDALPMTVTGKPQKFLMREAMLEELERG